MLNPLSHFFKKLVIGEGGCVTRLIITPETYFIHIKKNKKNNQKSEKIFSHLTGKQHFILIFFSTFVFNPGLFKSWEGLISCGRT
jgi:hypothetical protein